MGSIGQRHVVVDNDIELRLTVDDILKELLSMCFWAGAWPPRIVIFLLKNWPTGKLSDDVAYAPTTDTMSP